MWLTAIPKVVIKTYLWSFILWLILTTIIPQTLTKYFNDEVISNTYKTRYFPYHSLISPSQLPIQNSTVYYVMGHPDDETMFFSPSLIEVLRPKHNNSVKLICLLPGDYVSPSMGSLRKEELLSAARIYGIDKDDVFVLNYRDGMNETWPLDSIVNDLASIIGTNHQQLHNPLTLITFDEGGVSGHPNHIATYEGTKKFFDTYYKSLSNDYRLYKLKTFNVFEKYTSTILTNIEYLVIQLPRLLARNIFQIGIDISFFSNPNEEESSIKFFGDMNTLGLSFGAMSFGHFSQMESFRYPWILFSRYFTYNNLIQVL
ncbi:N-acetylglucosaminyl-phosphatidylinositol de-N-acetylase [Scheffersomyces spartinae]|uniref:N-acetylglucosaminylphosphatidylinositol deacetylase n=1 Tax=Scheffersomyces spartinae TaxID=45513 RepID=A0A9P7VBK2_9ASCO|nr:N-acetylglucosaminyl-phosphatidylinositol de-N-acetylase [Scheffersomyces spartinae]KAG7195008.1 N-acetylglucosaminyl-phosphatidylinositol de-N-acetylase [Scheffersomyces spartinae]